MKPAITDAAVLSAAILATAETVKAFHGLCPPVADIRQAGATDLANVVSVRSAELVALSSAMVIAGAVSIFTGSKAPLIAATIAGGVMLAVYEVSLRKAPVA